MDKQQSKLYPLFHPQRIAVIGVSRDPLSVGRTIFTNIQTGGFQGEVYPVNPHAKDINGVMCFPSVLDIPHVPDLAVIAVPAAGVSAVLNDIGKKGTKTVIIISAGFREIGKEGEKKEQDLMDIARSYGIAILGPNCLGVIHPHEHINLAFARTPAHPGSIALLSQSGALGSAILDIAQPKAIGFSHLISLGNAMDITEMDCLEYLKTDPHTRVIGLYVERLTDAARFITLCRHLVSQEQTKPVVVLKAGTTKEGSQAVHSHTGSLAGEKASYDALFRQAGVIEAGSVQEFLNTLIACSHSSLPIGNKTTILTNAGGPGILATDTLIKDGVGLSASSSHHNPWDLLGDATAKAYDDALGELANDPEVHSILLVATPQTITDVDGTADVVANWKNRLAKPLVCAWMGDAMMASGKAILDKAGVPVVNYPESAARMLADLHRISKIKNKFLEKSMEPCREQHTPIPGISLSCLGTLDVLNAYDIPVPASRTVSPDGLDTATLSGLSDTIAVKLLSDEVTHKSEYGAVRLNIPRQEGVQTAKTMVHHFKGRFPTAHISSILFMNMVDTHEGVECIVGIKRQKDLGTVIACGFGGVMVELVRDISMRFLPVTRSDIRDMLMELRLAPVFAGFRGKPPLDTDSLIQAILSVSRLAMDHPELMELDINPLMVFPHGVMALDGRMTLHP